ncbi:MAG: nucleotidyltransferase family protein [Flavobacteriales bacterium]|nr:nucleotidyltransferase family protein [Flavobacteriales bacterium]
MRFWQKYGRGMLSAFLWASFIHTILTEVEYLAAVKTAPVYQLLLLGSKLQLSEEEYAQINGLCKKISDWDFFTKRANGTHLSPLLFNTLSDERIKNVVPKKALASLENAQNQVLFRNIMLQQVFTEFAALLNAEKLPLIPLKGIYLSEVVYGNLRLRHLSDIDVLIKEEHLDRICSLMQQKGWEVKHAIPYSNKEQQNLYRAHPRTLIKDEIHIELHTHLYNANEGAAISKEEIWNYTKPESLLDQEIMQFTPEMQLQYLCLHLQKHLLGTEMKLLNFCDIREFLKIERHNFDWNIFKNHCKKYECSGKVSQILHLLKKYWSTDIPAGMIPDELAVKESEVRFWNFFTGKSLDSRMLVLENTMSYRLRNIRQSGSVAKQFHFLIRFVFPSKDFMRKCYGLNNSNWVFPWYLYRPLSLTAKTIVAVFNKLVSR